MSADYSFLAQPLGTAVGYSPDLTGKGPGHFVEPMMRAKFGEWDVETPDEDEVLVPLKLVHGLARTAWQDTIGTIEAVRADDDPSLNTDGRLKAVAGVVEPKIERLAKMAEANFVEAEAALGSIRSSIEKTKRVVDAVDLAVHQDIRAHLRSLGGAGTASAVFRAINSRDVRTLQAIATAPAYLSGIADNAHLSLYQRVQDALAEAVAPDLWSRAKRIEMGMARAAQALSALNEMASKTIDFKKARALRERSKNYVR